MNNNREFRWEWNALWEGFHKQEGKIRGKVISAMIAFILMFPLYATAQESTITGIVKDENSKPIPEAKVNIKNTEISSQTDLNGEFSLVVPQSSQTLVITALGFNKTEVAINNQSTFEITLVKQEDAIEFLSFDEIMNMVIVSASKKEEKLSDAPSNITVITSQKIKDWGARDIKDVLRRVAGYQVVADRDEWVFAARGNVSDNNQKYLIMIDGIRMNSIENFGPGNIIELPNNLSNVKRIEVIKGPGSAVWGADALAGVINIITKDAADLSNGVNVAATIGQDGYYVGDFQMGEKVSDDIEYVISGSVGMQKGKEITQSPATGWPYLNPGTDQYTTLLDNHRPGYMLNVKARVDKFSFSAMTFETEVYNRHFEYGMGREHYLTTNKNFVQAAYNDKVGKTDLTVKVNTFSNHAEYRPAEQGDNTKLQSNIAWRDRGINTTIDTRTEISNKFGISAGLDYTFTKLGPNQRIDNFNADDVKPQTTGYWFDEYNEDSQIGGYVQLQIKPIENLTFTLGARGDYNDSRGSDKFNVNPRAAIVAQPLENTTLKAIYNRGYLRPTNFQAASTEVQSETMDQFDFILMQKLGPVNLSATAFWQKLNGFILILPGNVFANVGDYTSTGLEFEANANINNSLNVWGNLSLANPKGENFNSTLAFNNRRVDLDGNLLSYAKVYGSAGLTYRLANNKLSVSPAIRYASATKYRTNPNSNPATPAEDIEANYAKTPAFTYLDMNVAYKLSNKVELSVYGDNLLNTTDQTHLTVWNGSLGQYGTHVSAKLRVNF